MKRFFNSMIVLLCMYGGILGFTGAWVFLLFSAGFVNACLFAGLVWCSAIVERNGAYWAARYVQRRIRIAKVETAPDTERSA